MTIQTIAPRFAPDAQAAGRADAYDEHRAGTNLDTLTARLDAMTLHLNTVNDAYAAYVAGYGAYVTGARIEAIVTRRIANEAYVEWLSTRNHPQGPTS